MLNSAKLAVMHYSPHPSTTDCTTETMVTETLNTTNFIEVNSHTETGSSQKAVEGLSEQKNLE